MLSKFYRKSLRAFTLVELLVVIVIIGILSTIILVSFNTSRMKARDNKRISDVSLIASALGQYYTSNLRQYPLPGNPVVGTSYSYVNTKDSSLVWGKLSSYISPIPSDPDSKYGYYYIYRVDGKKAAVVVLGLEGGRSKCNITAGSATATATATSTAGVTTALPDPVASFVATNPTACYYVSL